MSNAFQKSNTEAEEPIKQRVLNEFEAIVNKLNAAGINTFVFDDTSHPPKPDAIFPTNWIKLHQDGRVFVFPMYAPNRRYERRLSIIEELRMNFIINEIVDLTQLLLVGLA